MEKFFESLFEIYPAESGWKLYTQNAIKFCIKYKNNTNKPRPMTEYRSGRDGKIELDQNNNIKLLDPGESRWIAIEPSDKSFYYADKHYGAAAYPKKIEDAKNIWTEVKYDDIKKYKLVIPYYQIADTIKSLYPNTQKTHSELIKDIKNGIPVKHLKIFKSNATAIGRIIKEKTFDYFPSSYREVPMDIGSLLLIELDPKTKKLKKSKFTYILDKQKYEKDILVRIIDKPAVKAALWRPVKYDKRAIISTVKEAISLLTA